MYIDFVTVAVVGFCKKMCTCSVKKPPLIIDPYFSDCNSNTKYGCFPFASICTGALTLQA